MSIKSFPFIRIIIVLLLTALLLNMAVCGVFYAEEEDDSVFPSYPKTSEMRVFYDGLLICRGYYYNDQAWFSFQDLYSFFFKECKYDSDTEKARYMTESGTVMDIHLNDKYTIVNGRYIYIQNGYHTDDSGKLYFSADVISRIFGFNPSISDSLTRADLFSSDFHYIEDGESYYSSVASKEDLFWLPKIINAEAGLCSIEGQIAVGNVVLNRVNDPRFPNTIKEVIFDTDNGRQFQPIDTGTISYAADELAIAASRLVLEGYNTANDSIYFVESWTDHSWLNEDCFVCKFDSHLFYRG